MVRLIVRILCGRGWGSVPWWVGYGKMRVLCGMGEGLRRGARARRRGLRRRGSGEEEDAVRVLTGLRPADFVVLVTISVV